MKELNNKEKAKYQFERACQEIILMQSPEKIESYFVNANDNAKNWYYANCVMRKITNRYISDSIESNSADFLGNLEEAQRNNYLRLRNTV